MFEKLFVKTSDLVLHKITPYAVERESFPAHHVKRAHTPQILELLECAVLLGGSIQADIALAGVLSPGVAGYETVECVERRVTGFERATFRSRNSGVLPVSKRLFTLDTVEPMSHRTSQNLHLRGSN